MSSQNYYKANLRDLTFLLFEQFKLDELLGKEPFANWGKDEVLAVLEERMAGRRSTRSDQRVGRRRRLPLDDGQVRVPAGFKEA